MYVCMYVCMYGWMDGCMYVCMYVWMYVCMYAYIYIILYDYVYIYIYIGSMLHGYDIINNKLRHDGDGSFSYGDTMEIVDQDVNAVNAYTWIYITKKWFVVFTDIES